MKCFIITLFDNSKSVELATKAYESAIKYDYKPSFFAAYNGETSLKYLQSLDINPIYDQSIFGFNTHLYWCSKGGTRGCFASHYKIWNMCVELNENIIVLEHDAVLVQKWQNPVWQDVMHLDNEGSLRRRSQSGVSDFYNDIRQNSVYNMGFKAAEYGGIVSMNCAYAYAITPQGSLKLIEAAKNHGWFAVDRFMREPIISIDTIHPKLALEQPEALEMFTTSF